MKKLVVTLFAVVVAGSTLLGLLASTAQSRPQYFKAFKAKYVKADGSPDDQAFAAAVNDAKCLVCHVGESRKNRNSYGKDLAKYFEDQSEKNVKDTAKIDEGLDKVADIHVDPNDPKSPTYGDLIKAGKLPGGDKK
jgi:cytochrome c551/c552